MSTLAYVDASALAKLVLDEPGAMAMRRWYIESERVVTSRIGIIETRRACSRQAFDADHLAIILKSVETAELDARIADAAGLLGPTTLRTLDAIHVATALQFVPDLDAFVTYDDRLADAARSLGLPVLRPA